MNEAQVVKKLDKLDTRLHLSSEQMIRGTILGTSVYVRYGREGLPTREAPNELYYGYRTLGMDLPLTRGELIQHITRFSF